MRVRASEVAPSLVARRHILDLDDFSREEMELVFETTSAMKEILAREIRRVPTLRGKTVGIVGLGHIGKEVARLSKAFGMRVIATRRSAPRTQHIRNVDLMLPRQELPRLLAESDYVVITLPYTHETDKLLGETELKTMKSSAYLMNIGRGGIIDEDALTRALSENWIAGAGLDVFTTEPLPAESKLWELPNLLFSPHVSGDMEDYVTQATEVFCKNLGRYLEGKRLLNVVDKHKGY